MLTIGDSFPRFKLTAVKIDDTGENAFVTVNNDTYKNKWQVWIFWPKDFTFICPTEIVGFGKLINEFVERDAQLIGCSTDSEYAHLAWRQFDERLTNSPFPWIADIKKQLCDALGIVLNAKGVTTRATFIVDPENIIRFVQANDLSVGRSPKEVLRTLDALQTKELCPCDWQHGESTLGEDK